MTNEQADAKYVWGRDKQGDLFSFRTAATQAKYFLPHLKPGISVLDCGCGSGSITLGLAEAVAPGRVVGIDLSDSAISHARSMAAQTELSNVEFEIGDAYNLPYADESFDAVFSHCMLEHLRNPQDALAEMRRVLKPGGVIGITDIDADGAFTVPSDDPVAHLFDLAFRVWEHNGGHPRLGKHVREQLHSAGFVRTEGSVRTTCQGTKDALNAVGSGGGVRMLRSVAERAVELGWAPPTLPDSVDAAWSAFAERPEAFTLRVYCEALGWKE